MKVKRIIITTLFLAFISYSFFVYTVGTETRVNYKITNEIVAGKLSFQKHNCIACHQIYGLGGYLGPDLTTVISQMGKGDNYARAFIKNGTIRMPDYKIGKAEEDELIAYLKYVDATATTYK